jgi:hypothetical protein
MTEQRHDLIAALGHSLKAIDDDFKEEMRELRALFADAKHEAEKDEPDRVKLKALLTDAGEAARTFATLDPAWQAVQRVARLFGI